MEQLPVGVLLSVFQRLSPLSLAMVRMTCHQFNSVIKESYEGRFERMMVEKFCKEKCLACKEAQLCGFSVSSLKDHFKLLAEQTTDVDSSHHIEPWKIFEDLPCSEDLLRGIYSYGLEQPSTLQQYLLPPLCEGKNISIQAHIGQGKTLGACVGMLSRIDPFCEETQALYVCPTREIARNTALLISSLKDHIPLLNCICVFETERFVDEKAHCIIGTPGMISALVKAKTFSLQKLKMIICDEVEDLLDYYMEGMRSLLLSLSLNIQYVFTSTSGSQALNQFIQEVSPEIIRIKGKMDNWGLGDVKQFYVQCENEEEKFAALMNLLEKVHSSSVVFCNTRKKANWLGQRMNQRSYSSWKLITSSQSAEERFIAVDSWRKGEAQLLILTDILVRGIDIYNTSVIINYELPSTFDMYCFRLGRSGRFGRQRTVISLIKEGASAISQLHEIQGKTGTVEEMPTDPLQLHFVFPP